MMYRSNTDKRGWGASIIAALTVALAACGGLIDEVGAREVPLALNDLPTASSAVVQQPVPGCEVATLPDGARLAVLRHPDDAELGVAVLEDGTALCIDEPAAILERYPTAVVPAVALPPGVIAYQPQDDDPVPITDPAGDPRANVGGELGGDTPHDDDPVPIKGAISEDSAEGNVGEDQPKGDDPVPIHGQNASS